MVGFSWYQHSQFDAIEAQLRRREPVLLDLQTSPVAAASSVAFDGMLMPANSFHGLDPKMYDTDGSDPSGNSRPLQVYIYIYSLFVSHLPHYAVRISLFSCFVFLEMKSFVGKGSHRMSMVGAGR